jgi:hypothetical protein
VLVGLDQDVAALERLDPHVEQPHTRPLDLGDPPRVGAPHHRELHQVERVAADRRTDVEDQCQLILAGVFRLARVDARKRRLADALDGAELTRAGEDASAGIAGTDGRLVMAVGD